MEKNFLFFKRGFQSFPYIAAIGQLVLLAWTVWAMVFDPRSSLSIKFSLVGLINWGIILIISAIFWLAGTVILAYTRSTDQGKLFFWVCQIVCLMLINFVLASLLNNFPEMLYKILLWLIAPLIFHLHWFLVDEKNTYHWNKVVNYYYGISFLAAIFCFLMAYFQRGGFFALSGVAEIWLLMTGALIILLLIKVYIDRKTIDNQRRSGRLIVVNLFCFGPMLLFLFVKKTFDDTNFLPPNLFLLFLGVLPIGYSYLILRYKMIRLERYIDRGAAFSLVGLSVAAIYGSCYLAFSRLLPNVERLPLILELTLAILLIFAVQPLFRILKQMINRLIYGAWYDDLSAMQQMSASISQSQENVIQIGKTLCQVLERTIPVEYANLLLFDGRLISGDTVIPTILYSAEAVLEILGGIDREVKLEMGSFSSLYDFFKGTVVGGKETFLGSNPKMWVLMKGADKRLGLLILGPRRGSDFDKDSLETIELLVRQTRMALENVILIKRVRKDVEQINHLNRQMVEAREEERKGLARELHDHTIQSLYGLNYQISALRHSVPLELCGEIQNLREETTLILNELRQICRELRPPELDALGVIAAMRSYIRKFRKQYGIDVQFRVDSTLDMAIPSGVDIAFYRILQEALSNSAKHAEATRIEISIAWQDAKIQYEIWDNGKGFKVPEQIKTLVHDGHFGLAGMQERVDILGGEFFVLSGDDAGTRIVVRIPC
jgi:signal transduction histidine kinase